MGDAWGECQDVLVGMDDLMIDRVRYCTVCGRPSGKEAKYGLWPVLMGGRKIAVAYTLCPEDARNSRASHQRLDTLLRQRYTPS
jgi:hypothetical protein